MFFFFIVASISCFMLSWFLGTSENAFENLVRKYKLLFVGIVHMALSKDKKVKATLDSGSIEIDSEPEVKKIIFIRHGESEWNEVFNRGFDPSFLIRLLKAVFREFLLLPTRDSVLFDSPLSEVGILQAQELVRFLENSVSTRLHDAKVDEVISILNGDNTTDSIITTSNLRRAIATGFISMWERFKKTGERYYVLSMLQEITLNIDGISLLEPGEKPDGTISRSLGHEMHFETSFNSGTKPVASTGLARINQFSKFAFDQGKSTIICVGHSGWFRDFFRTFLPFSSTHISKKKKLVNCGVVSFMLMRGKLNGRDAYRIDPDSIVTVYGGFENK